MADADTQPMRAALTAMLDGFVQRRPDWVLFTTFNFSSAFFEANVLPLLSGSAVEELAGSAENAKELNTILAQVRTLVVCDRSALPEAKGEYRYALMPVGLASGRFHPKVILMSGELAAGGKGLSLAVASANLSLSGWAVNREVVGVTEVAASHVDPLDRLLSWLEAQAKSRVAWLDAGESREEGQPRIVLAKLRQALKADARPDRPGDPTLHIGLPTDTTALIDALAAGGPWTQATAVSPFWGELDALCCRIGAEKMCFVPSIGRAGQYGFPLDTLSDASADFLRFQNEADRYTHAKALLLEGKQGNVLAIGSANFTGAALMNSEGGYAMWRRCCAMRSIGSIPGARPSPSWTGPKSPPMPPATKRGHHRCRRSTPRRFATGRSASAGFGWCCILTRKCPASPPSWGVRRSLSNPNPPIRRSKPFHSPHDPPSASSSFATGRRARSGVTAASSRR